ncbi:MAG: DUF1211 domain-containing protein [Acidobacteria bacterium]|nr:DUF1211 domain-containing protein [Acidobacteriota bacterium]MCW5949548.1 DUF1211 domain-containing protein [Pyrinomonadaceae bacterium]
MTKTRLEAFSDAVIAIVMTIMVLEMKVPHGSDLATLEPLIPVFLAYVLSFVYLGIYWNNHHHMMHAVRRVNGRVLWANLLLLFWLSLIPFATGWMGENHFAAMPTLVYGVVLLGCAISYSILQLKLVRHHHGENDMLKKAVGSDLKGKISLVLYVIGIAAAAFVPTISHVLYVVVALIWIIPDRRIERFYEELEGEHNKN